MSYIGPLVPDPLTWVVGVSWATADTVVLAIDYTGFSLDEPFSPIFKLTIPRPPGQPYTFDNLFLAPAINQKSTWTKPPPPIVNPVSGDMRAAYRAWGQSPLRYFKTETATQVYDIIDRGLYNVAFIPSGYIITEMVDGPFGLNVPLIMIYDGSDIGPGPPPQYQADPVNDVNGLPDGYDELGSHPDFAQYGSPAAHLVEMLEFHQETTTRTFNVYAGSTLVFLNVPALIAPSQPGQPKPPFEFSILTPRWVGSRNNLEWTIRAASYKGRKDFAVAKYLDPDDPNFPNVERYKINIGQDKDAPKDQEEETETAVETDLSPFRITITTDPSTLQMELTKEELP